MGELLLEQRRRIYLLGLLFGIPCIFFILILRWQHDTFITYTYPFLQTYLIYAAWQLLTRKTKLIQIEKRTFYVVLAYFLIKMTFVLFAGTNPAADWAELTPSVYFIFVFLATMSYLVFSTTQALQYSLGIVAISSFIGSVRLIPEVIQGRYINELLSFGRYEVFLVVIVVLLYILARSKDVTAQIMLEKQHLQTLAYKDSLTSLPNRRQLMQELNKQLITASRYQRPLSIILFDLDHFKTINDTYGHGTGDIVLSTIAQLVTPHLRVTDTLGRWGGEEFMLITPETNAIHASQIAERVRQAINRHTFEFGTITASFGVNQYHPSQSLNNLIHQADTALYQAKDNGRNQVIIYKTPPTQTPETRVRVS